MKSVDRLKRDKEEYFFIQWVGNFWNLLSQDVMETDNVNRPTKVLDNVRNRRLVSRYYSLGCVHQYP